jgi:hypothetical protein
MNHIVDNLEVQDTLDREKSNYVIVFDIDGTLCNQVYSYKNIEKVKALHPECLIIPYLHKNDTYNHIFIPYLQILMNYLITFGSRIVFFSSAIEDRNSKVITTLLEETLGKEQYQLLKYQGQFDILSKQHMRPGNDELGEYGNNIKDFTQVIKNDETLLDAILIEDQPSYAAYDQQPCISIIDVERWAVECGNESRYAFPKNTIYYLLGLFKTYFDNSAYRQLPLREGIGKILLQQKSEGYIGGMEQSPFVHAMIDLGLNEVRKTYPDAIFYGHKLL